MWNEIKVCRISQILIGDTFDWNSHEERSKLTDHQGRFWLRQDRDGNNCFSNRKCGMMPKIALWNKNRKQVIIFHSWTMLISSHVFEDMITFKSRALRWNTLNVGASGKGDKWILCQDDTLQYGLCTAMSCHLFKIKLIINHYATPGVNENAFNVESISSNLNNSYFLLEKMTLSLMAV